MFENWFDCLIKTWIIMLPLSIWKLIEILIWIFSHIKIEFV